jgi:hypothetical protein
MLHSYQVPIQVWHQRGEEPFNYESGDRECEPSPVARTCWCHHKYHSLFHVHQILLWYSTINGQLIELTFAPRNNLMLEHLVFRAKFLEITPTPLLNRNFLVSVKFNVKRTVRTASQTMSPGEPARCPETSKRGGAGHRRRGERRRLLQRQRWQRIERRKGFGRSSCRSWKTWTMWKGGGAREWRRKETGPTWSAAPATPLRSPGCSGGSPRAVGLHWQLREEEGGGGRRDQATVRFWDLFGLFG